MKLKCIKDTKEMLMFPGIKKIDGLTLNKTYSAFAMSPTAGYHVTFFVFNDNNEWTHHAPEQFVPWED